MNKSTFSVQEPSSPASPDSPLSYAARYGRQQQINSPASSLHESCTTRIFGALGSTFVVLQCSKSPQPALLQVNSESRRETIAMYGLIFGTQFHIGSDPWVDRREFKVWAGEPRVYFNASTDTIYFSGRFICGDFDPFGTLYPGGPVASVIKSLRSIAVDVEHFTTKGLTWYWTMKDFLECHKKVEEIILVINKNSFSKVPVKGNLEFIALKSGEKNAVAKVVEEMEHNLDSVEMENQVAFLARKKVGTHNWVPDEAIMFDSIIPGIRGGEWVEREEPLDVDETVEEPFI